jgi:hypothetical protein
LAHNQQTKFHPSSIKSANNLILTVKSQYRKGNRPVLLVAFLDDFIALPCFGDSMQAFVDCIWFIAVLSV